MTTPIDIQILVQKKSASYIQNFAIRPNDSSLTFVVLPYFMYLTTMLTCVIYTFSSCRKHNE